MCSCAESFQSIPDQSTEPMGHPTGNRYLSMDRKLPSAHSLCPPARNKRASAARPAATPPASSLHLWQKEINSQLRIPLHTRCASTPLLFLDRDVSRRIAHRRHRPENSRSQTSARSLTIIAHFGMRRITDSE